MKILLSLVMTLTFCGCTANTVSPSASSSHAQPPATSPAVASSDALQATSPATQPEELGKVRWLRNFAQAQQHARQTNKPMFVLFTEVPGCNTVRGFARTVLSDPAMIRAIEREFVPVVVYNNIQGVDREVLSSFEEPTWNNPVVRIMTPEREALASRFAGPYTMEAMSRNIVSSYTTRGAQAPTHLSAPDK